MVRAANARDADSLLDRVSPGFRAEDGSSRADVEATVRRLFAGYDSLRITVSDLTIERSEGAALARFRADLAGTPRAIGGLEGWLPRSSSYLFEVRLAPSGDRWRASWASWKEARSGGG